MWVNVSAILCKALLVYSYAARSAMLLTLAPHLTFRGRWGVQVEIEIALLLKRALPPLYLLLFAH